MQDGEELWPLSRRPGVSLEISQEPVAPLTQELRGYQIEAYEFIRESSAQRLYLEAFCGGGKTVIYQKIFEEIAAAGDNFDCFILLVPGITLMTDMRSRWQELVAAKNWGSLWVSSEENYATTDASEIKRASRQSKLFVCVTIQSFKKILVILEKFARIYLIGDEAHHLCESAGQEKSYSPLRWLAQTELTRNIKKMLFATATPKIGDYESLRRGNNQILMNNPEYFGSAVELMGGPANLRRLRREEFLCPYEVIMGEVDPRDLTKMKKHISSSANETHRLNYQASAKLLRGLLTKNRLTKTHKKILMYTTKIGGAAAGDALGVRDLVKIVAAELSSLRKNIGVFHADSGRFAAQNMEAVKSFEDAEEKYDATILVNCRMYSEGINLPALDTVMFCDPKQSLAEIIQIFGRPLRRDPLNPNKVASIIVPYLSNLEYCDSDKYKKILDIVSTISTQDEFLRDELRLRNDMGVRGDTGDSRDELQGSATPKILKTAKLGGGGNLVEFAANAKLFDFLKTSICQDCASVEEAVLVVLGDYVPKTPGRIRDEIMVRRLWRGSFRLETPSIADVCEKMRIAGVLLDVCPHAEKVKDDVFPQAERVKDDACPHYFIERPNTRMGREEFLRSLVERGIFAEIQYRQIFGGQGYPENYPPVPASLYPGMWEQLLNMCESYTLDECRELLEQKEDEIMTLFGAGYKTHAEQTKILCEWDPKIPCNILSAYGLKNPTELNKKIFRLARR
jgi:superfamily II DNA or RNA helicase